MSEPLLSVVVCSHQRPVELERCLDALARLEDDVEVVVVDSGSQPPLREVVDRFSGRIERLSFLYEPEPGLSRARNRGTAAASSSLVGFVDDDACVEPDWARRIAPAFADPSAGCAGGRCRPAFTSSRPRWLSDRLLQFAGITCFGSEAREARATSEYPFGANLCFRREALEAVGGFDERLGRIGYSLLSGKEYAAMSALRRLGWRIWLQPDAIVDYYVSPERCFGRYYRRRLYWQGVTHARSGGWRRPLGLCLEAPAYLLRYVLTRDRYFLYRATAETAGHFGEWTRRLVGARS